MKVKDLIKDLYEYKDQEIEVCVFDRNHPDRVAFEITHTSVSNRYILIEIETSPSKRIDHRKIADEDWSPRKLSGVKLWLDANDSAWMIKNKDGKVRVWCNKADKFILLEKRKYIVFAGYWS